MSSITFCWWKDFPPKEAEELQVRILEEITNRLRFAEPPVVETQYVNSVTLSVSVAAPFTEYNLKVKQELTRRIRQRNVPVTIHLY